MIISGVQRCSTIDFPGSLACVLFAAGCDLDCFYCHNRGLLTGAPALPGETVMGFLERRRGLLDGVVVSGGEPTLQRDLPDFLARLRAMGYRTKLDTNGQRPKAVPLELVDYVAVDWKAPRQAFPGVCGAGEEGYDRARATLLRLLEAQIPCEARTTLYPGLTGAELLALAAELPPLPRYRLNFFRMPENFRPRDRERLALHALTPGEIKDLEGELRRVQPNLTF